MLEKNNDRIKLSVNIFDDEKIKLIRKMPEGNSIVLIWIQLLCLASKTNDNGAIYLSKNICYTNEMLADICDEPLVIVRASLEIFRKFGLIEGNEDEIITIKNWRIYQD